MDIRVRNSRGEVESRHYPEPKAEPSSGSKEQREREREAANDDVGKLLALKRNLLVKGAEMELISLCKGNQQMRRALLQVRELCLSEELSPEDKLQSISALLKKY